MPVEGLEDAQATGQLYVDETHWWEKRRKLLLSCWEPSCRLAALFAYAKHFTGHGYVVWTPK